MNGNEKCKILQGWKLCCSGIPVEQVERLKNFAYRFGATWVEFDSNVSVLICTKVGSIKTRAAQQLGIPLVHPDWLLSLDKFENPIEAMNSFRLKPLQGLFISVTGLSLETRRKVEQICAFLGASYSGDLSKTCTHLIGLEPKGLKYEFALKCKMHIVTMDWLWSCQKYERLIDESQYKLTTGLEESTAYPLEQQTSDDPQKKRPRQSLLNDEEDPSLSLCTASPSSLILLSCRIYLLCCTEEEIKRGSQLLHLSGATRSSSLFSPLTHILFGSDRHFSDLHRHRELVTSHFHSNVRFVTFDWLNCCINNRQLLHDAPFRVSLDDLYPIETFSFHGSLLPEESNSVSLSNVKIQQNSSSCVFRGLRFRFHTSLLTMGGLEQELSNEIQEAQGVMVQDNGVPTHLIVGHGVVDTFPEKICIVTSYWVKSCLRFRRLLPPNNSILFRPLQWRLPLETMMPCKITLSGFHNNLDFTRIDYNRQYIIEIIHLIGASYLERLSKRYTTHLIVENANSEKYQMALKWGIPVVRLDWLFACFQSGTRVPVDRYRFIEQTMVANLSENMDNTIAENASTREDGSIDGAKWKESLVSSRQESEMDNHCFHPLQEISLIHNENKEENVTTVCNNPTMDRDEWVWRKRPYWSEEDKWDSVEGLSQVVVFEDKESLPYFGKVKSSNSS